LLEQELIVAEVERRLSFVEELGGLVVANLQRAARLRETVLTKAFSGRLHTETGVLQQSYKEQLLLSEV